MARLSRERKAGPLKLSGECNGFNTTGEFMKRSVCRIATALLFGVLGAASVAHADRVLNINPEPFYRFRVPSSHLGYLLTRNYQEGVNLGYIFEGALTPSWGAPPAGLMPTPIGNYTIPVYRHRVNQRSTPYYYFANGINYGPGYVFEGIAGYALPAYSQGVPFHVWYSQNYGYWYTANPYENPPNSTYSYHGVPFNLFTQAGSQTVVVPDCPAGQQQSCNNLGGDWNNVACTCEAPADQCGLYYQNICAQDGGTWNPSGCYCEYPDLDPCEIDPWSCQPCNDPQFDCWIQN